MIGETSTHDGERFVDSASDASAAVTRGSIPLYFQIERMLRDRLRSGHYPADRPIPAEVELCAEFNVSRSTVRQALAALQREGLITRQAGRGSFPRRADQAFTWQVGSVQDIFNYASETKYRLLSRSAQRPPPEVARVLKIPNGATVMLFRGIRSQAGPPFGYTTTWLLASLGEQIKAEDIRSRPIVVLIEALCGVRIAGVDQRITAVPASKEIAGVLEVPVRSPILIVKRLYFSREGVAVDFAVNYFTPQRFEYHQRLTRFRV